MIGLSVANFRPVVGAYIVVSGTLKQTEGTAIGTAIGTISVLNGSGNPYTFTLADDPDSAFTIDVAALKNGIEFDYETATQHELTINADDGMGSSIDGYFIVEVVDVPAPVLSAATDTATGATTATTGVTTTGADGTLYVVVTTSATAPTAAQIKAGEDHLGAAAAFAGDAAVASAGAKTINATGLTTATAYFAHFMHEGLPSEQSNVASGNGFTTE